MIEHLRLSANGIHIHALAEGPSDGPLVVLLHGFPELALSWSAQLEALGGAGYRAVAPDLRGYGDTSKAGPYDVETLALDLVGLIRALGRKKATVVGHDWGGGVAWATAIFQPQVVERLVLLNCPHPGVFDDTLRHDLGQLRQSWYMFFFQIPKLPEWVITRDGGSAIMRSLRGGSARRDVWTRERLEPYMRSMLQPGAASAAVGYYRAAFRGRTRTVEAARKNPIAAPTLILWGMDDRFLKSSMIEPGRLAPWFAPGITPTVEKLEGVGHFVQVEAPERVNAALLKWLGPVAHDVPR